MDYYNQIDPYDQEQLPYQTHQSREVYDSRQYMEQPVAERSRSAMPSRMPRAEALTLVQQFKKWLIVASLVGFGVLTGLVADHAIGFTSTAIHQHQQGGNTIQQFDRSQSHDNDDFFRHHHGRHGFGQDNTQQQPVSGSYTP